MTSPASFYPPFGCTIHIFLNLYCVCLLSSLSLDLCSYWIYLGGFSHIWFRWWRAGAGFCIATGCTSLLTTITGLSEVSITVLAILHFGLIFGRFRTRPFFVLDVIQHFLIINTRLFFGWTLGSGFVGLVGFGLGFYH